MQEFISFKHEQVLDLKCQVFSITSDGAPNTKGKNVEFVKLIKRELGDSRLTFHCTIHAWYGKL